MCLLKFELNNFAQETKSAINPGGRRHTVETKTDMEGTHSSILPVESNSSEQSPSFKLELKSANK